jgi:large subunit ribosomal protein L10
MSKVVKQMELDALSNAFGKVRDFVFLTSGKVDAALDYNFRKTLREKKIRVQMVKNTLAKKVLKDNGIEVKDVWAGTTLVAWGADSIKTLSTTIDNLLTEIGKKDAKNKDKIKVKGANGAVADGIQVPFETAKTMPTRLEAIGSILGMILGPASQIAACLTGPAGQVASQIVTISERKEEAAPPAAPEAAAT